MSINSWLYCHLTKITSTKDSNHFKPIVSIIFILRGLWEQSLTVPQDSDAVHSAHEPDIEALPLGIIGALKALFRSMVSVIWH